MICVPCFMSHVFIFGFVLQGLLFAFAFAVFETRAINTQESKDLSLTINSLMFTFDGTVGDDGSVTPLLNEIFITSAVEHDGEFKPTLKFISRLYKDRLDSFTENMTAQLNPIEAGDGRYIPKKMDPELIFSIDGSAVPSPVTELDLPMEPSIEDKLRMLESTTDTYQYNGMIYDKVYKGYFKSYKFPRPLKVRFRYTRPSSNESSSPYRNEYIGEMILRPEDFTTQETMVPVNGRLVYISPRLRAPKTIALSPFFTPSSSSSSPPSPSTM